MKNTIISKSRLRGMEFLVLVELSPETAFEIRALSNWGKENIPVDEKEFLFNYFAFNLGLGEYSIVREEKRNKNIFSIVVAM